MGYSTDIDGARAYGRNINVSWKKANQVCAAIRGMFVEKAIKYLDDVIAKKQYVPFKKYNTGCGHRPGGVIGKYPEKAAKAVKKVLLNAKNNAEQKGFDISRTKIVHATAYKGISAPAIRSKGPRNPYRWASIEREYTNIEIVVKQV